VNAECANGMQGRPFYTGSEHRHLAYEQIFENLTPADAGMDLQEKCPTMSEKTQRGSIPRLFRHLSGRRDNLFKL
jgi:hypothetical protein